jgi:hypothetical protein
VKPLLRQLGILWGVLAIVVGSLAMWGGGIASAAPADKYPICHVTASHSNPYVLIEVAATSIDGITGNENDGQGDHLALHTGPVFSEEAEHWGDIIPPVDGVSAGSENWTQGGQAIFENGCQLPIAPSPSPSASPTPTPTPTPSATPTPTPSPTPTPTPTPTPSATPTPTPTPTDTGGVLAEVSTVPNASTGGPTGGSNPALPIGIVLLMGLTTSAYLVYRSRLQS